MSVKAIVSEYTGEVLDRLENFHGNQVLYVGWDRHMMFCAPFAFPVDPKISFRALIENVISEPFGEHEEFASIDWSTVQWLLNGEPFVPDMDASLQEQGILHKSALRFITPGLNGFKGADV